MILHERFKKYCAILIVIWSFTGSIYGMQPDEKHEEQGVMVSNLPLHAYDRVDRVCNRNHRRHIILPFDAIPQGNAII